MSVSIVSRTSRLFDLLQILRNNKYPISGKKLSDELGISLRTLYRDIATLQSQGANIEGEPGLGYVMQPGFMLPPLMFSEQELEALVLGMRWVVKKTDSQLQQAAKEALAKIESVLPQTLRYQVEHSTLMIGPSETIASNDEHNMQLRQAIRDEWKVQILYHDLKSHQTKRMIWPFGLGYFDDVRILIAWCELRQAYRHFRLDRIKKLELIKINYPKRRHVLIKEWRELNKIPSS